MICETARESDGAASYVESIIMESHRHDYKPTNCKKSIPRLTGKQTHAKRNTRSSDTYPRHGNGSLAGNTRRLTVITDIKANALAFVVKIFSPGTMDRTGIFQVHFVHLFRIQAGSSIQKRLGLLGPRRKGGGSGSIVPSTTDRQKSTLGGLRQASSRRHQQLHDDAYC